MGSHQPSGSELFLVIIIIITITIIYQCISDLISYWLNSCTEAYLSRTISPMSEEDKTDKRMTRKMVLLMVMQNAKEMTQTDGVNQVLLCPISAQPETKGAFRQRL